MSQYSSILKLEIYLVTSHFLHAKHDCGEKSTHYVRMLSILMEIQMVGTYICQQQKSSRAWCNGCFYTFTQMLIEIDCFLNPVVQNRTWPCQWPKTFFRGGTKRATPVIRKIVKRGVGWRICFWFSLIRIVNISAIAYLALVHIFRGSHDDSPLRVNRKDNILSTP